MHESLRNGVTPHNWFAHYLWDIYGGFGHNGKIIQHTLPSPILRILRDSFYLPWLHLSKYIGPLHETYLYDFLLLFKAVVNCKLYSSYFEEHHQFCGWNPWRAPTRPGEKKKYFYFGQRRRKHSNRRSKPRGLIWVRERDYNCRGREVGGQF